MVLPLARGSVARYVQKYGGVILSTAKTRRRMRIDSQTNGLRNLHENSYRRG